ncbi:hypothetical protein GCM10023175_15470 [Pseudonocardia xishanensis]|uniref:Uncharacterized protein n=1 Tax=Pseudonocardia xishanensis TaxID=630995 RepID=A0ABP8RKS4_9PSEU
MSTPELGLRRSQIDIASVPATCPEPSYEAVATRPREDTRDAELALLDLQPLDQLFAAEVSLGTVDQGAAPGGAGRPGIRLIGRYRLTTAHRCAYRRLMLTTSRRRH